jgi:hypothetical protein
MEMVEMVEMVLVKKRGVVVMEVEVMEIVVAVTKTVILKRVKKE